VVTFVSTMRFAFVGEDSNQPPYTFCNVFRMQ